MGRLHSRSVRFYPLRNKRNTAVHLDIIIMIQICGKSRDLFHDILYPSLDFFTLFSLQQYQEHICRVSAEILPFSRGFLQYIFYMTEETVRLISSENFIDKFKLADIQSCKGIGLLLFHDLSQLLLEFFRIERSRQRIIISILDQFPVFLFHQPVTIKNEHDHSRQYYRKSDSCDQNHLCQEFIRFIYRFYTEKTPVLYSHRIYIKPVPMSFVLQRSKTALLGIQNVGYPLFFFLGKIISGKDILCLIGKHILSLAIDKLDMSVTAKQHIIGQNFFQRICLSRSHKRPDDLFTPIYRYCVSQHLFLQFCIINDT